MGVVVPEVHIVQHAQIVVAANIVLQAAHVAYVQKRVKTRLHHLQNQHLLMALMVVAKPRLKKVHAALVLLQNRMAIVGNISLINNSWYIYQIGIYKFTYTLAVQ